MRCVTLPGTEINVSRLSFGTASLHHLPTSRRRQYLLVAAFDHGFTHFDTAPYYGYGIAEQELGLFLKGRQGRVTITTKVGLYPPGGLYKNTASVWLRKITGRVLPTFSRPVVDWSIAAASKSLESSLRRLGIDHVDLLLLHEPAPNAIQSEVFLEWIENERKKGKIRAQGFAGEANCMGTWLSTNHPLAMVLQVRDSLNRKEADTVRLHGRDLQITFGYFSSSATSHSSPKVAEILEGALRRNTTGSVLVSTRQLAHLYQLAAIEERDNGDYDRLERIHPV